MDFHDLRSCVDSLQRALRWRGWSWSTDGLPSFLDPREAAVLVGAGGRGSAGWIGRIAVPVLRAFEIDQVVYAFELDVAALAPKKTQVPSFVPFSRFPAVERDLAFVVPDAVAADWVLANVERAARKGMKDSFLGVELFDVYRGKGIPDAARSLALRFRFRAPDRTLEDKAVDRVMERVEKALEQHEGITLRR